MISTKSGKKVFDYEEVAALVGVSVGTIRRYASILQLSLYTELGKVYFDEAQIVKLVEKRNNPGTKGKSKKKKS